LGFSGGTGSFVQQIHYVAGARGSYHFNEALKIVSTRVDVYGGASVFYRYNKIAYWDPSLSNYCSLHSSIGLGIHAGMHYYLSSRIGAFGEVGYGISTFQFGVTFKF
ncbi:MAG TPA: hypothetical protein VGO09_04510, partial [Flavisolibacter sp.]|nr:hypothetical protein [Flavisolibacter sp.]